MKIKGMFTGGPVTITVGPGDIRASCSECRKMASADAAKETFDRLMARLRFAGCPRTHGVGAFETYPDLGPRSFNAGAAVAEAAGAVADRFTKLERQVSLLRQRLDKLERETRLWR